MRNRHNVWVQTSEATAAKVTQCALTMMDKPPFMRRKATADACTADKLPVGVPRSKSVPRQGAGANTRPTPRLWDG